MFSEALAVPLNLDLHNATVTALTPPVDIEGISISAGVAYAILIAIVPLHLKRILELGRLRLQGPCSVKDEFHLAATAQNLRKQAKTHPSSKPRLLRTK